MTAALARLPDPAPTAGQTALGPVARSGERGPRALSCSFEFFPPKSEAAEETLWAAIRRLEPLEPAFVSVTYGAGGSTRERTHRTVKRIVEETTLAPAAHLTCVEASREDVDAVVREYWDAGVRHIVALRGDPPDGAGIGGVYRPRPDGYANATELTAAITRIAPFDVSIGVYPETHPEQANAAHDLDVLKAKVDAGATRAISQFFFDVDAFLRFADRAADAGVAIPILPGIMPVTSYKGLVRMAGATGATIPPWLANLFEGLDDDPEDAAADRGLGGGRDVRQARGARLLGFPLLHAEPRRPGLRGLPRLGGRERKGTTG